MPRGDKTSYTNKQRRQARHMVLRAAKRRAWATVNKETGGGKKSGSGRGQTENLEPSRKAIGWAGPRPHAGRPPNVSNRQVKPLRCGSAPQQCLRPAKSLAFIRLRSVWNYSPV